MKKLLSVFSILLCLFVSQSFVACGGDDEESVTLSIDGTGYSDSWFDVGAFGDTITLSFTINTSWKLECLDYGTKIKYHLSQYAGEAGHHTITLIIGRGNKEEGNLWVNLITKNDTYYNFIVVNQKPLHELFFKYPANGQWSEGAPNIYFNKSGGEETVLIKITGGTVSIDIPEEYNSWLSRKVEYGEDTDSGWENIITIKCDYNHTDERRTGAILIKMEDYTKRINIIQRDVDI